MVGWRSQNLGGLVTLVAMISLFAIIQLLRILLPIGQVEVQGFVSLYAHPVETVAIDQARHGDTLLVYERWAEWVRTEQGWMRLSGELAPAVVQYAAQLPADVALSTTPGDAVVGEMPRSDSAVGVVAIYDGYGLLYSDSHVGWAPLQGIDLEEPNADLIDFVERTAYLKVEQTPLYSQPSDRAAPLTTLQLGRQVAVLFTQDDWILVRANQAYGWAKAADFDLLPGGQVRGTLIAGPVNFRDAPSTSSRVLTVLDYQQTVLVLGRSENRGWLLIRANGIDGWISAEFVGIDIELDTLPIIGD